jgi:superfamily II DNA or RNA helicase
VATGRYLGEGFDDARLDTLFLTMPKSWCGTLAQYAGRFHRLHAAKREVVIYDYVDLQEPLLAKMAARREAGYKALGYEVTHAGDLFSRETYPRMSENS